jgi:hypothetical protein
MAQLVSEKDSGLRQAMRTMGLMESSYWGSWLVFDLTFAVILALVIVLSGERAVHPAMRSSWSERWQLRRDF